MTASTGAGATLRLQPLYGAQSAAGPAASLLHVGDATVLLDCGWDDAFDVALLEPLVRVLPEVDLVLLSHPETRHLGALPYLVGRAGLRAPVYAAAPVASLGPLFLYDAHASLHAEKEFDLFGPEDIDAAFDSVKTLKHHQAAEVEVKGVRLRLLGLPAGHMVGGTVWVVEVAGEVVVYAADTNHTKERHLNGGQLASVPVRPALVVLDARHAHAKALTRGAREQALEAAVLGVLRRQGSVLMPVDSAGRMLELLLLLDRIWQKSDPRLPYPLALLSCVASSTVHAARGLLEWMSDELQREFNTSSTNPLTCKNVTLCHCVADVARLPPGPKVVLATGVSLDQGMARQLLLQWGADPRNAVLFTQQPRPGSLAADLLAPRPPGPLSLHLTVGKRVLLRGAELEAFEAARAAAEAEAAGAEGDDGGDAAAAAAAALPLRESSGAISQLKRSNTGGVEQVLVGAGPGGASSFDAFAAPGSADAAVLLDGFQPPPSAVHSMFPDECEALAAEWDAYGAVVDVDGLRQAGESLEAAAAAAEDDDMEEDVDAPTKVVTEQVQLVLAATVALLEGFEGVSDGRSLRTIVASVAPRALALVGGTASDTADMAAACARELPHHQTRVLTPACGEEVSLPLAASYPVDLSWQLLQGLSRHKLAAGGVSYEVAWLDSRIGSAAAAAEECGGERRPRLALLPPGGEPAATDAEPPRDQEQPQPGAAADADGEQASGGPEAAEREAAAAAGDHGGIFIGDVKLSEVKQALARAGVPSEFRGGGRLVVGGALVVRRDGADGQLLLEGPLCEDYFRVRDVVYGEFNVC